MTTYAMTTLITALQTARAAEEAARLAHEPWIAVINAGLTRTTDEQWGHACRARTALVQAELTVHDLARAVSALRSSEDVREWYVVRNLPLPSLDVMSVAQDPASLAALEASVPARPPQVAEVDDDEDDRL